jgi:UDP-N-acetylglucosamine transferase subunit ALG13
MGAIKRSLSGREVQGELILILITVGTQRFQFNRLLRSVDQLVEEGVLTDSVIAQIGYSDYKPRHYTYSDFYKLDDINKLTKECDVCITHGGIGSILNALNCGKKVIVMPRKKILGEHVDDHQSEISAAFQEKGYIQVAENVDQLRFLISGIDDLPFNTYIQEESNLLDAIKAYIQTLG